MSDPMSNRKRETSGFPDAVMECKTFLEVTDDIAELVNSIKQLQAEGKYKKAADTIAEHGSMISSYILTADDLNFLDEETRAIEIYVRGIHSEKPVAQAIYYQVVEPSLAKLYDVWI